VIWANATTQAQGATVLANTGSLADLWVRGARIWHGRDPDPANDGYGYGNPVSFNLVTRLPNRAPVATPTAATQTTVVNTPVAAATLFSYSDQDNDPATNYEFWTGARARPADTLRSTE